MKNKSIAFIVALILVAVPALGQISGYVSANFYKSQEDGDYFKGTFGDPLFGLIFTGDISTGFSYGAEFRISDISDIEVDQAWVGLSASEAFTLQGGLYLVPFGIYNRINRPHETALIVSPLHVAYCYPQHWRDIGVSVDGKVGGFVFQGYLGNGLQEGQTLRDGQQFEDNNKNKGKGGRIGWQASKGFELAYSINDGKYDDENSRNLTLHGVDVNWVTEDWQIMGEYTKAIIKNPENTAQGEAEGYFIQVVVYMDQLQPFVSYQKLNYTDPYHGVGFSALYGPGEGISIDRNRWALGVVYMPAPNLFIKFEYDFNREKPVSKRDDIWAVQAAVRF
jgi:hypothetical protein